MLVKAIYENGVFRSVGEIDLPEHTDVVFEPRVKHEGFNSSSDGMEKIYEILSMRFDDPDSPENIAERHNEHQP